MAKQWGFTLLSYLHTGIQDGKGSIDGHFAVAMKHVVRYCKSGNNVTTSTHIVEALRANGGVNNSSPELITINRRKIKQFVEKNAFAIDNLTGIKGHMDVEYNQTSISVRSFKHSGVGAGTLCSMSNEGPETTQITDNESSDEEIGYTEDPDGSLHPSNHDECPGEDNCTNIVLTTKGIVTGCLIYGGKRRDGGSDVRRVVIT